MGSEHFSDSRELAYGYVLSESLDLLSYKLIRLFDLVHDEVDSLSALRMQSSRNKPEAREGA